MSGKTLPVSHKVAMEEGAKLQELIHEIFHVHSISFVKDNIKKYQDKVSRNKVGAKNESAYDLIVNIVPVIGLIKILVSEEETNQIAKTLFSETPWKGEFYSSFKTILFAMWYGATVSLDHSAKTSALIPMLEEYLKNNKTHFQLPPSIQKSVYQALIVLETTKSQWIALKTIFDHFGTIKQLQCIASAIAYKLVKDEDDPYKMLERRFPQQLDVSQFEYFRMLNKFIPDTNHFVEAHLAAYNSMDMMTTKMMCYANRETEKPKPSDEFFLSFVKAAVEFIWKVTNSPLDIRETSTLLSVSFAENETSAMEGTPPRISSPNKVRTSDGMILSAHLSGRSFEFDASETSMTMTRSMRIDHDDDDDDAVGDDNESTKHEIQQFHNPLPKSKQHHFSQAELITCVKRHLYQNFKGHFENEDIVDPMDNKKTELYLRLACEFGADKIVRFLLNQPECIITSKVAKECLASAWKCGHSKCFRRILLWMLNPNRLSLPQTQFVLDTLEDKCLESILVNVFDTYIRVGSDMYIPIDTVYCDIDKVRNISALISALGPVDYARFYAKYEVRKHFQNFSWHVGFAIVSNCIQTYHSVQGLGLLKFFSGVLNVWNKLKEPQEILRIVPIENLAKTDDKASTIPAKVFSDDGKITSSSSSSSSSPEKLKSCMDMQYIVTPSDGVLKRFFSYFLQTPLAPGDRILHHILILFDIFDSIKHVHTTERVDIRIIHEQLQSMMQEILQAASLDNIENFVKMLIDPWDDERIDVINRTAMLPSKVWSMATNSVDIAYEEPIVTALIELPFKAMRYHALHGKIAKYCITKNIKVLFNHKHMIYLVDDVTRISWLYDAMLFTTTHPKVEDVKVCTFALPEQQWHDAHYLPHDMRFFLKTTLLRGIPLFTLFLEFCTKFVALWLIAFILTYTYGSKFALDYETPSTHIPHIQPREQTLMVFLVADMCYELGQWYDTLVATARERSRSMKQSKNLVDYLNNAIHRDGAWNVLDLITVILLTAWASLRWASISLHHRAFDAARATLAMAAIPAAWSLLRFAYVYKPLGIMVIQMRSMFAQLVTFLLFYIACISGFAICFYGFFYESPNYFSNSSYSFLSLLRFNLGDFSFDTMGDMTNSKAINYLGQVVLAIYLIMTAIVLMNLLIAQMTNSVGRIMEHAEQEWAFGYAHLLQQYITFDQSINPVCKLPAPLNGITCITGFFTVLFVKLPLLFHPTGRSKEFILGIEDYILRIEDSIVNATYYCFGVLIRFLYCLYRFPLWTFSRSANKYRTWCGFVIGMIWTPFIFHEAHMPIYFAYLTTNHINMLYRRLCGRGQQVSTTNKYKAINSLPPTLINFCIVNCVVFIRHCFTGRYTFNENERDYPNIRATLKAINNTEATELDAKQQDAKQQNQHHHHHKEKTSITFTKEEIHKILAAIGI